MPTELRAECRSFELCLVEPGAAPEIRGRVRFRGDGATTVTLALALLAQAGKERIAPGRIDADTPIAGCSTSVARNSDEDFTLPLPLVARPYAGVAFQIAVGVVATADDGGTLRIVVVVPPVAGDARLVLRGLPKITTLARPGRFGLGVLLLALGAALVSHGSNTNAVWAYGLGSLLVAFGFGVAAAARHGMPGWLRAGNPTIELAAGDDRNELVVSVRGSGRISGGSAQVVAVEYEVDEGATFEHREIASRQERLAAQASSAFTARVPLPPPSEAPPALALRGPKRLIAIRWLARLDLETRSGAVARSSIPIHVGIEPAPRAEPAPTPTAS